MVRGRERERARRDRETERQKGDSGKRLCGRLVYLRRGVGRSGRVVGCRLLSPASGPLRVKRAGTSGLRANCGPAARLRRLAAVGRRLHPAWEQGYCPPSSHPSAPVVPLPPPLAPCLVSSVAATQHARLKPKAREQLACRGGERASVAEERGLEAARWRRSVPGLRMASREGCGLMI